MKQARLASTYMYKMCVHALAYLRQVPRPCRCKSAGMCLVATSCMNLRDAFPSTVSCFCGASWQRLSAEGKGGGQIGANGGTQPLAKDTQQPWTRHAGTKSGDHAYGRSKQLV